jgi:hypothetical protein
MIECRDTAIFLARPTWQYSGLRIPMLWTTKPTFLQIHVTGQMDVHSHLVLSKQSSQKKCKFTVKMSTVTSTTRDAKVIHNNQIASGHN